MKRLAPITVMAVLALAAAIAAAQNIPKLKSRTLDGITYLTGGVGIGEREAMRQQAPDYNLRLTFVSGSRGAYLGVVNVRIRNAEGRTLLRTKSDGPWFFAKLPAGSYTVFAVNQGQEQSQQVEISGARTAQLLFRWPS